MQDSYKWDVEEIQHCAVNLKKQRESLEGYKSDLMTLREDVSQAWQSIAGTAYEQSVEKIDENLISQIIEELEAEIGKLEDVVKKDYQVCEETLKGEANTLASNIRAL